MVNMGTSVLIFNNQGEVTKKGECIKKPLKKKSQGSLLDEKIRELYNIQSFNTTKDVRFEHS
jgi:hypothetical protein